jgi:hypothetical protein
MEEMATMGEVAREAGGLSEGEWDALSRTLKRMILTCELLVTYALSVAGKPSRQ